MKRVGHFTNINQFTKKSTIEVRYMHTEKSLSTVVFLAKNKKQAEEICMAFNKILKKKGIGGIQKVYPKKHVTKKSNLIRFYL
jgi:intein-encoded DNA endonuclease-like protein